MRPAAPGPRSARAFHRASAVLAGGVNSPVRAFRAVGGTPVFFASGRGAYLRDVDGRSYLDFVNSWGACLLGHAPAPVVRAVRAASVHGTSFGAPTPAETELAEEIRTAAPLLERLRFVNSGTEATMSAVRLARAATKRDRVVKLSGGYHGHSDGLLASAGSGVATQSLPDSAGVPRSLVRDTIVVPYNDPEAMARVFESRGDSIAAVLVEPVAGNMGVVPPVEGYLAKVERLCRAHGALLIADEVITGFRLRRGTASESLGVRPDLVTLGKIIGGGLPVGAYGGRSDLMDIVAPNGPVYQAGTLAGNPVAMAAGLATLRSVTAERYRRLERRSAELERRLVRWAAEEGEEPFLVQRVGSMFGLFFCEGPVHDLAAARRSDRGRYARFFHAALDRGVYLPPSPLETIFTSMAQGVRDLAAAEPAFRAAFRAARPA